MRRNGCIQTKKETRAWYHRGRRLSSDDSFHSPTVIPPSALDKPSIMKRYHPRWTCSHTSPRRWTTMVTLHDTQFVQCQWWNDGWTVKTVITWRLSASMIPAPEITTARLHFAKVPAAFPLNCFRMMHNFPVSYISQAHIIMLIKLYLITMFVSLNCFFCGNMERLIFVDFIDGPFHANVNQDIFQTGSGSGYIHRRSQSMAINVTKQGERINCFYI